MWQFCKKTFCHIDCYNEMKLQKSKRYSQKASLSWLRRKKRRTF